MALALVSTCLSIKRRTIIHFQTEICFGLHKELCKTQVLVEFYCERQPRRNGRQQTIS